VFPHIREKPGNFIPLSPGRVMPLKIEKTAKIGRNPLKFGCRKSLDNIKLLVVLSSLYNFGPASGTTKQSPVESEEVR
jgi:hypothetical protein